MSPLYVGGSPHSGPGRAAVVSEKAFYACYESRMTIQKKEFYEGAALHRLIREAADTSIRYDSPLFVFGESIQVYLKYSTRNKSPWAFTFTAVEQLMLYERSRELTTVIGLVCGFDGIAALPFDGYESIARNRPTAIRVACYRRHREFYEISGPDAVMAQKIPPSNWHLLLTKGTSHDPENTDDAYGASAGVVAYAGAE